MSREESLTDRKQDNNLYDNAIAKNLAQQIQERTRIQSDLEFDNKNLETDRETIIALETRRQQEVDTMLEKIERLKAQRALLRSQLGEISRTSAQGPVTSPVSIQQPTIIEQPVEQVFEQPIGQVFEQPISQPIDGQIIIGEPQRFDVPIVQPREVIPRSVPQSIPFSQPLSPTF